MCKYKIRSGAWPQQADSAARAHGHTWRTEERDRAAPVVACRPVLSASLSPMRPMTLLDVRCPFTCTIRAWLAPVWSQHVDRWATGPRPLERTPPVEDVFMRHSVPARPMRGDFFYRREPHLSSTMRGFLWGPRCEQGAPWRQRLKPLESGLLRRESTLVRCVTEGTTAWRAGGHHANEAASVRRVPRVL